MTPQSHTMSQVPRIKQGAESQFDPYDTHGNTAEGTKAIKRWSAGDENDFAARMDWSVTGNEAEANHHPVAVANGDTSWRVLEVTAAPGSTVMLDANGSSDPDNNALTCARSFHKEPGSCKGSVSIKDSSSSVATVSIPADAGGKSIHVTLELHDNGSPELDVYRRVIIEVKS
jgi:hypothetical protein